VRCSELASALGEELVATAPHVREWQVAVHPGPWSRDAVADAGLAPVNGAKPLLVRRPLPAGRAFLVCTNGARDPCCALFGAAVVRALGEAAVECTHLGGHRFAANVLVLPDNLLFGRLDGDAASALAAELDAGRLPLPHLRGRCDLEPEQQAGEILLRRELGLHALDDVVHRGGMTFATPDAVYDVRVQGERLPPRRVSCRDVKEESPVRWRLDALTARA
jgi:hypothetical protein